MLQIGGYSIANQTRASIGINQTTTQMATHAPADSTVNPFLTTLAMKIAPVASLSVPILPQAGSSSERGVDSWSDGWHPAGDDLFNPVWSGSSFLA